EKPGLREKDGSFRPVGALLGADAGGGNDGLTWKTLPHVAGQNRAFHLRGAEFEAGCAPGENQFYALEVGVAGAVVLPAHQPAVHQIAGLSAHHDEFEAEPLSEPFTHGQRGLVLDPAQVTMDEDTGAFVPNLIEVCAGGQRGSARILSARRTEEYRQRC